MAEGEGFEPSVRESRTPPFQGGTINHSAILPGNDLSACGAVNWFIRSAQEPSFGWLFRRGRHYAHF